MHRFRAEFSEKQYLKKRSLCPCSVYQHLSGEAWGHSTKQLLEELPSEAGVTPELVDNGRILDRFYIPTCYPNGFENGKPADYYTEADSRQAIGCAEAILRFCADRLSR